ncbi:hypothetical protein IBX65_06310 [Candidatus Aerophobetes bacterium]|nr:hypothetical protein [Candidatus Aerophobetes bacterium]
MDEKILKDIASTLEAIRVKLDIGAISAAGLRGPVADPSPGWARGAVTESLPQWAGIRGPVADPAPWYLLDKAKLAQLKIRQIDAAITELEKQIDFLKLERNLLKEEYKIK